MRYPELLYTPSDFDLAKAITLPGRVADSNSTSGLFGILFLDFGPVPRDRVLVVSNVEGHTTAGAAQTTTVIRITLSREDGQFIATGVRELLRRFPGTLLGSADWQGEVHVMPGEILRVQADFSAAAASNNLFASYFGILVPRANYQFNSLGLASGGV